MIANESEELLKNRSTWQRIMPWLSLGISLLLVAAGLWYLARKVSLAEVGLALRQARLSYVGLGLAIILITLGLKAWRWQLLLSSGERRPPFQPLFWSMMLGQYVNVLVPFFRLGELARVHELHRQTKVSRIRGLSTLLLEKSLELVMLGTTFAVLISSVVLPEFVGDSSLALGFAALVALALLYFTAYQTERVVGLLQRLATRLPEPLGDYLTRLGIAGLEGLASLRDRRLVLALTVQSVVIALMAVTTPLVLFSAMGIQFGLVQAAILHVAVSLAVAPPSTPGKLLVFDGTVAILLRQLGLEQQATIVGYTLIYHLVTLLPQIVLGGIAATRANWRWQQNWSGDREGVEGPAR